MLKKVNDILTDKERRKLAFLTIAVIVGSILELFGVTVFMPFSSVLVDTSKIHSNRYLNWLYTELGFSDEMKFVVLLAVGIIIVYIVKNLYLAWEKNAVYEYSFSVQRRLSLDLLRAYMNEPYTFFLSKNTASLQRAVLDDTDSFTKGIFHAMELMAEVLICIILMIYLLFVSKSITLIVIGVMGISLFIFTSLAKKQSNRIGRENQIYKKDMYQEVSQSLGGVKEIKILGREENFIDKFDYTISKYVHGLKIIKLISIYPKYFVEASSICGVLAAVIFKIYFGHGSLDTFLPQMTVFAIAAFRLLPSVGRINEHYSAVVYAEPSLDLICHDLNDVKEAEEEKKSEYVDKDWKMRNQILVKNISYCYPDKEDDVLSNVSFSIPKGKTIAFIGQSGAGKTTMADIILGLLKPQKGHIYADDIDIFKNRQTWQRNIGYIPQTIFLSDDTIKNNIAFGIDEKDIDDDAVNEAMRKAQIYDFVQDLEDGVNTYVGDRGIRISGGQRQRIGIARALYYNPEVLVLDEATSSLDNDTEKAVMESIDSLHGQKTMLIIAHRLSTIRNVDAIFEVTGGKIIERSQSEVFGDNKGEKED